MTTIAWDGYTLAADKLATSSTGVKSTTTKIRQMRNGDVAAIAGCCESGFALMDWLEAGAKLENWPKTQETDNWATLIVIRSGVVWEYEKLPVPQLMEDSFMAWGSGRLAALAAMDCGKDAALAVQTAAKFDCFTGNGYDSVTVNKRIPTDEVRVDNSKLTSTATSEKRNDWPRD